MANKFIIATAPHMHNPHSTQSLMRDVVVALMPALVVSAVVYGLSVLYVTAIAVVSCVLMEYLIQKYIMKGTPTIGNLSAVVTGLLLAFNLPAKEQYEEPDVEIELDEYRSYGRSKRSCLETSK